MSEQSVRRIGMKPYRLVRWAFLVIAVAWVVLFLTASGVLVFGERLSSPREGQDSLRCIYFTGMGFVERPYWYSETGMMGRSVCPRLVRL